MAHSTGSPARSFPVFFVPLAYAVFACLFADRLTYLLSLLLTLILFLGSHAVGRLLCRLISKATEECYYFPLGLGVLLLVIYPVLTFTTLGTVFYCFWFVLTLLAIPETKLLLQPLSVRYLWGFPFVLLGFWSTFTPSTFFDTLVYHLGLPHQYLAYGRMMISTCYLYSTLPPFDQVLNLLFVGVSCQPGIKAFSLLLYLYILFLLVQFLRTHIQGSTEERMELLVVPMLLLPTVWIQIHWISTDLLVSLFFCSGVLYLVRHFDSLTAQNRLAAALLLAFSLWTKYNVLLYLGLFPVLWIGLSWTKFSWSCFRQLFLLSGLILLLAIPLLIRNFQATGDPLYPALARQLELPQWDERRSLAFKLDHFPVKSTDEFFLAPLRLTFHPEYINYFPWNWLRSKGIQFERQGYGSASEIGLVFLLSVVLFPFAAKYRFLNPLLIYVLACYAAWLFSFHNFRQFFPPFLLLGLLVWSSFHWLSFRSRKALILCLALCAFISCYFLAPYYLEFFRPIRPGETQEEYLQQRLEYFAMAQVVRREVKQGRVLLLGDSRIAYYPRPLITSTAYDPHPLLNLLSGISDVQGLLDRFRKEEIRYILCNWKEYSRLAMKYGLLPIHLMPSKYAAAYGVNPAAKTRSGAEPLHVTDREKEIWQEFVSRYLIFRHQSGSYLFLYEIRSP